MLLLDGNAVADLGPLTRLTALENLGLHGNRVGDVTALQDLARLRRLDLTGNPAADLSPLGDVGSLVFVALPGRRAAESAATLRRLTRLGWVWFGRADATRPRVRAGRPGPHPAQRRALRKRTGRGAVVAGRLGRSPQRLQKPAMR